MFSSVDILYVVLSGFPTGYVCRSPTLSCSGFRLRWFYQTTGNWCSFYIITNAHGEHKHIDSCIYFCFVFCSIMCSKTLRFVCVKHQPQDKQKWITETEQPKQGQWVVWEPEEWAEWFDSLKRAGIPINSAEGEFGPSIREVKTDGKNRDSPAIWKRLMSFME